MGLKRQACSGTGAGLEAGTRSTSPPSLPRDAAFPRVSLPGLLIQQVIFFICSAAFTFLIVIPLQSGTNTHLFRLVQNMW